MNNPLKLNQPAVIHSGEGIDAGAGYEIDKLTRWNILNRDVIAVHGVAMNTHQAKKMKAVIWCPDTNFFLLGKTASIHKLKMCTTILFGSDSALTADWDIWKQIRLGRKTGLLTDDELCDALTSAAAKIWNLNTGKIAPGKDADIIIVTEKASSFNHFLDTRPEDIAMVIRQGKIRVVDEELLHQLYNIDLTGFSRIYISGRCKYVEGDLPGLINQIRQYHPHVQFPVRIGSLQTV